MIWATARYSGKNDGRRRMEDLSQSMMDWATRKYGRNRRQMLADLAQFVHVISLNFGSRLIGICGQNGLVGTTSLTWTLR